MQPSNLSYRMLELTALSGEVSPSTLCLLSPSNSYAEKIITALKDQKLLKLHYKDKLRGLRLTDKGKKYLLGTNTDRFDFYLTGNSDTNHPRSAVRRRIRLHQAAIVYQALLQAGICIFRDEKPLLFEPGIPPPNQISFPIFYHSRELKCLGTETIKINNSRAMGLLLTQHVIYVIYYTGDHVLKWDYATEVKLRILLTHHVRNGVLSSIYNTDIPIRALLLGSDMNTALQLMTGTGGSKERFFHLDQSYNGFHYLPLQHDPVITFKFLHDINTTNKLNTLLSSDLLPPDHLSTIPHDAKTVEDTLILFGYHMDMLQITRFFTGCSLWNQKGNLICFDFQKGILQKLCPHSVTITAVNFEMLKRRFFPEKII